MEAFPTVRRSLALCCLVPAILVQVPVLAAESVGQAGAAQTAGQVAVSGHSDLFATVNGKPIRIQEYENTFAAHVRQKFYHREIPAGQLEEARREVKDKVIQRVLLLEEAGRRGIVPNQAFVDEKIAGYEAQYASSQQWKENRERLLPGLRQQLEEQNLLAQLEQQVRNLPEPKEEEVRAFYDANPDLFTEPEKIHLSAILLAVDPGAPPQVRQATRDEAQSIYKRLMAGANFEDAARLHSNSKYAETGGDMGYLHRGMLPEILQEKVDSYEFGKINEPVDTLEGSAIFRLNGRKPPQKREFADVAQRAKELIVRESQEKAWKGLQEKLMAAADVTIHHQLGMEKREDGGK